MPHGIGYYGTQVIRKPRTVKRGGRLLYDGRWYQSDELIPLVGERVMFDFGVGVLEGRFPVYECWTQRIVDARRAKKTNRKRQHRTVEGSFICYVKLEKSNE